MIAHDVAFAIGRALMTGPRLLLIDEMSAGLAPKTAQLVVESLRLTGNAASRCCSSSRVRS